MDRAPYVPALTRREALGVVGMGAAAALPVPALAKPTFPQGAVIRAVLKDYAPEELAGGATLFHEHLSFGPDFGTRFAQYKRDALAVSRPPHAPANEGPVLNLDVSFAQDANLLSEEISIAKREGVSCIVDAGTPDMGRDVGMLRKVSMKSGMPIVASAGFYAQPFYPREIATMSEDQVYQTIMNQVEADPIGAFGEIGSWDYITKDERKVFRAVGRAHVATGIPILTHTGGTKSALEQLDILEDAGVDPKHVAIGHLYNLVDPKTELLRAICRRGAFVGFDNQGGSYDEQTIPIIAAMIDGGYADNLLFSSDFADANDLKRKNSAMGYAKTLTVYVPKLKRAGINDEILRQITHDNSRRFLAFVPKIKRKA